MPMKIITQAVKHNIFHNKLIVFFIRRTTNIPVFFNVFPNEEFRFLSEKERIMKGKTTFLYNAFWSNYIRKRYNAITYPTFFIKQFSKYTKLLVLCNILSKLNMKTIDL